MKNDEKDDISRDLAKLIVWAFKGSRTKKDIVVELSEAGFSVAKIAMFTNMPSKNVSSLLIQSKKSK
jgi:hypothetical protein